MSTKEPQSPPSINYTIRPYYSQSSYLSARSTKNLHCVIWVKICRVSAAVAISGAILVLSSSSLKRCRAISSLMKFCIAKTRVFWKNRTLSGSATVAGVYTQSPGTPSVIWSSSANSSWVDGRERGLILEMKDPGSGSSMMLLMRDNLGISRDGEFAYVFSNTIWSRTAHTYPAMTDGRSVGWTPIPDSAEI